jgi:hypothetical protein
MALDYNYPYSSPSSQSFNSVVADALTSVEAQQALDARTMASVKDTRYGVKGDGYTASGTIANGATALTVGGQTFLTSGRAVVGQKVLVTLDNGAFHVSTIDGITSNTVLTIHDPAPSAASNKAVWWGTDDQPKLATALAAGVALDLPEGRYLLGATLTLPAGCFLEGRGKNKSNFVALNITGAAIETCATKNSSNNTHQVIRSFGIEGAATTALDCRSGQVSVIEHIRAQGTWTDVFKFAYNWACTIRQITGDGSLFSNALITIGDFFNQNTLDVASCGGTVNPTAYGILVDSSLGSAGNSIRSVAVQSVDTGLFVRRNPGAYEFTALYTENARVSVRFGDKAAATSARNVTVRGGTLYGPYAAHPNYALRSVTVMHDNSLGCAIDGAEWVSVDAAIGAVPTCHMMGFNAASQFYLRPAYVWGLGAGASIYKSFKRSIAAINNASGVILGGAGASSNAFQIFVKSNGANTYYSSEYTSATALTNTSVTPGYITTPPVGIDPTLWTVSQVFAAGATTYNAATAGNAVWRTALGGTSSGTVPPATANIGDTYSDGGVTDWVCVAKLGFWTGAAYV